jgi:hypothetical protein
MSNGFGFGHQWHTGHLWHHNSWGVWNSYSYHHAGWGRPHANIFRGVPAYGFNWGQGWAGWQHGYRWYNGYFGWHSTFGHNHWTFNGGPTDYESHDMDDALKKTLLRMYTRALYIPELVDEQPYSFVRIDVPYRNFLSILQTQLPYLELLKETVIDSVDFEVMHNSLSKCVDKAVMKANGFTPEGDVIPADREHVMYNYWLDQAVQFFGDKSKFETTKNELRHD